MELGAFKESFFHGMHLKAGKFSMAGVYMDKYVHSHTCVITNDHIVFTYYPKSKERMWQYSINHKVVDDIISFTRVFSNYLYIYNTSHSDRYQIMLEVYVLNEV